MRKLAVAITASCLLVGPAIAGTSNGSDENTAPKLTGSMQLAQVTIEVAPKDQPNRSRNQTRTDKEQSDAIKAKPDDSETKFRMRLPMPRQ